MTGPGERELIAAVTEAARVQTNRAGFESDCAILELGDRDLVATTDAFTASTHLPEGTGPRQAGRLAAGAALSDLAAAGADLLGALVACQLPPGADRELARELGEGLAGVVEAHGGEVLGGDTKPRDELGLVVTALGTAPAGTALTRATARPGDALLVTGPLGGAGAALERLRENRLDPSAADPLMAPAPRFEAGRVLRETGGEGPRPAAMDLSDGLADAAVAIAQASEVRVVVDEAEVPLHPWAREAGAEAGRGWALSTGGDYELAAAVPGATADAVLDAWRDAGLDPARVGRVEAGEGAALAGGDGNRPLSRGYEHGFDDGGDAA